ncbi:hypothetical protein TcBrA4_0040330 [Trypanosoma cruzi]|nr:hypothetical protein TcBrA4_0040330 [Trypanosoma cruzi]
MNEGRVTTNKTVGVEGYSGTEAAIGMSRKVYMWFDLAHRLFPNARYIAKGDDDMFLRVPLFVAHLRLLPRRGIYMGVHSGSSLWVKDRFIQCVVYDWLVLHLVEGCGGGVGVLRTGCGAWHTCRTARNVRKSFFLSHAARRRNGGTCASERSEVQPDGIRQGAGLSFP